jgi:hypothetical protein
MKPNVFGQLQGKSKGGEIIECGLLAQVKTPKPADADKISTAPA